MKGKREPAEQRFWQRVNKLPDGCWEWMGNRDQHGYGYLSEMGRKIKAHRLSWELANGPIPEGFVIDHDHPEYGCGNPWCVNPAHLEATTQSVNQQRKRGLYKNNTSGHRGVRWYKNRWAVEVSANGVRHYGGRYKTLEEAIAVAQQMRERLYGEGGEQ